MHGGDLIAEVLQRSHVGALFTLCGGHISPILVAAKARGIRVVDVRHEATAVFAADALARLTNRPGVAAVTAGPGATNTITALENARLAQSPVVLLVGAVPSLLRGRGALQDIDQRALFLPHAKLVSSPRSVAEVAPAVEQALRTASMGVPGPVVVECPVDLLYEESTVREWYAAAAAGRSIRARLERRYLERHLSRLFADRTRRPAREPGTGSPDPPATALQRARRLVARAERPVLLIGSQATLGVVAVDALVAAVETLAMPVYLSGMARGLLGRAHPLQMRHRRKEALREADLVVLAGVPCDFRLNYGRHIGRGARLVAANLSRHDLSLNRRPTVGAVMDPARFLVLVAQSTSDRWRDRSAWREALKQRDREREREIDRMAGERTEFINPVALCRELDEAIGPEAVIVADGGDFVATASYVIAPRRPLSWLDPGVFGTLGGGAGFALGAKVARPDAEVWILYGDGSVGYSAMEFDTFARHGLPIVGVVGNDGGWTQIAREQLPLLGDDVGTVLARTAYEQVAEACGAVGLCVERIEDVARVLGEARAAARAGRSVLVNAMIGRTEFRKGAISM